VGSDSQDTGISSRKAHFLPDTVTFLCIDCTSTAHDSVQVIRFNEQDYLESHPWSPAEFHHLEDGVNWSSAEQPEGFGALLSQDYEW